MRLAPYLLINIVARGALMLQEWDKIAASIRTREGIQSIHGGAEHVRLSCLQNKGVAIQMNLTPLDRISLMQ